MAHKFQSAADELFRQIQSQQDLLRSLAQPIALEKLQSEIVHGQLDVTSSYLRELQQTLDAQRDLMKGVDFTSGFDAISVAFEENREHLQFLKPADFTSNWASIVRSLETSQVDLSSITELASPSYGAALRVLTENATAWQEIAKLSSFTPFFDLENHVLSSVVESLRPTWHQHFVQASLSAQNLVHHELDRNWGVLNFLPDAELGGSIWWTQDRRILSPLVAALTPNRTASRTVAIDVLVHCSFCGENLIGSGTTLEWNGTQEAVLEISVVPICETCTERANEDPNYASKKLAELVRPALRLVETGGESDGIARGRLRLVEAEEEEDS